MPGNFTVAQFNRWDAAISKTSPGRASKEDIASATLVTGCVLQAISDGIIMRVTDENGRTRNFKFNPALALRLADAIPEAAKMAGWLDPDGTVIALPDPT